MANSEPLPPLVPDSPTATLLFDVWSGQRLVRGRGLVAPEEEREVAAAIAAQMHLRAGSNVMVFDDSGSDLAADFIRRFVPESSIRLGEQDEEDIYPDDMPLIFFASKEAHLRPFYFFFDLVIFIADGSPDQEIGPAFIAGDQLLTFAERESVRLMDDTPGRDMPPDVAFAGGIDR